MSVENQIVHIELAAANLEAAGKFYSDVFGWKVEQLPAMNYATFDSPEGLGGGFAKIDGQMYKTGTVVAYIQTSDLEGKLRSITAAGGKVVLPRQEIPQMGWFALFTDPSGTMVGLFTDKAPM
ncbi:MAG: VOC family protein [Bellilinea sp.]